MKLKSKIHLFTTLLMLILLILMNSSVYLLYEHLAIDTEYKQLKSRGEELLYAITQMEPNTEVDVVLRAYMPTNGAIRVVNDKQKQITSVKSSLSMNVATIKKADGEAYTKSQIDGSPLIMIEIPAIWTDGSVVTIQLFQRLDDLASNQELLKLILVAATILITTPVLLSNLALSHIILKPLERLSAAMKRNASSGTFEKIDNAGDGKDELAEIGRTFNNMMESLELNYQKQQQFVSNASHELKTPLTVIESYANLLLRRGVSNEKVTKEALEAIANESSRMNSLIVQMLELAKNKERVTLTTEKIDLANLLKQTVAQMEQAYNRTFELHLNEELTIYSDEQKLKQLFFIILDNARKYSEKHIVVRASKENDSVVVEIQDFGVGIPKEQLPHLFDRFFRVSEDRNRKTGGSGLGLAIAKELADLLQIDIKVESEMNSGTCFIFHIPYQMNREVSN